MGLRFLAPIWSRPTVIAYSAPFAFPSSPDTGPGLTDAGRDLVRLCNKVRIMLDLSHLNAAGFADIAALPDAPLVATHSNAQAITPSARDLTDRELDIIRDTGGMVRLNFAAGFLNGDGTRADDRAFHPMLHHLDQLIARLCEDSVGFCCDFNGSEVPAKLGDVAGMPRLITALQHHGFDDALLRKLPHHDGIAVLDRTWKA